ncbi:MAG: hypothetical protein U0269_19835 [Polyangiales bacterium]
MRSLSHRSLALSMLALSGCVLDQYSFNGRDGAASNDSATLADRTEIEAAADVLDAQALPDVPTADASTLDAPDAMMSLPDVATDTSVPCDPNERVPMDAVFVDGSRASTGDGSAGRPFLSISEAITAIETGGVDRPIVLAPSMYGAILRFENTRRNHRIVGGFSRGTVEWSRNCMLPRESWIIGGSADQAVNIAATATGTTTFERVAFRTRAAPQPGRSQYGIWHASMSPLLLREIDLNVSSGGEGVSPVMPSMAIGTVSCDRLACDGTPSAGRAGSPGMNGGAASRVGAVSPTMGFVPADGATGGVGTAGFNGAPGSAGASRSVTCAECVGELCNTTCAGVPQPACTAGQMTRACIMTMRTLTASQGLCGCGGVAGVGGLGGGGGHAAIGLFIASTATVTIENSVLRTGPGGRGAVGSAGGAGATGSRGAPGNAQTCNTACSSGWSACNCTTNTPASATPGNEGGTGGTGGAGGAGGAGAGGSSIVIVRRAETIVQQRNTVLVPGAAGAGATGPSGTAVSGASLTEQTF